MNLQFAFDPEKCVVQSISARYTGIKWVVSNANYNAWLMKYNNTRDVIIVKRSNDVYYYITSYMHVCCVISGIYGDIIHILEGSIKSTAVGSNDEAAQLFRMAGMGVWCLLNTDKLIS